MGGLGLGPREGGHPKPARLVLQPLPHTDVWDCVCEIGSLLGLLGPSIPACQLLLSRVWGVQFYAVLRRIEGCTCKYFPVLCFAVVVGRALGASSERYHLLPGSRALLWPSLPALSGDMWVTMNWYLPSDV